MATFARSRQRRTKRGPQRREPRWSAQNLPLQIILALLLAPMVYILGRYEVIDTRTAIATAAMILLAALLYFPLRYRTRLNPRGKFLAWVFAIVWFSLLATPVLQRVYPPPAMIGFEVTPKDLPFSLPTSILQERLELKVTGYLRRGQPHATRNGKWSLRIEAPGQRAISLKGSLRESWGSAGADPDRLPALHRSRITTHFPVPPLPSGSEISYLDFRGQALDRLSIIARPNVRQPLALQLILGLALIAGAAVYDRASGAGRTAAALTVVTGAAVVSVLVFPNLGAADATFRELFGAIVAGALVGGPVGGIAAWILGARKDTPSRGSSK